MPCKAASIVVALILAVSAAGCGEDREEPAGTTGTTETDEAATPSGRPVATVEVRETEFKLDPANPRVAKAGVVEFRVRNDGKVVHALEVEGPEGEVETENIDPGQSATLTADLSKPGTYEWYCPVGNHKDLGMEGKITVAGGSSRGSSESAAY